LHSDRRSLFRILQKNKKSLTYLKNKKLIYSSTKYTKWNKDTDIFQYLKKEVLLELQQGNALFLLDFGNEGFSPYQVPYFDFLYFNCQRYSVSPKNIIYITSNLYDLENLKKFLNKKNLEPLNVFCYPFFERNFNTRINDIYQKTTEERFETAYIDCQTDHKDRIFSSLSRKNRKYRTIGTYFLCDSDIARYANISHDAIPKTLLLQWFRDENLLDKVQENKVLNWNNKLPLIIDRLDFDKNWALPDFDYKKIHSDTIFQIVNETEVEDYNNTSLFFSEKTFRPIENFQPFVIYGQRYCNHYLKSYGYKLYDDWFDLSFDMEKDPIKRYEKLLKSIKQVVDKLKNQSPAERIEWRFKNKSKLIHNFNTMITNTHSLTKIDHFLFNINGRLHNGI
jgi:hypothetical protein